MSQTIAHRHHAHVHIPLTPIIAVAVTVIVAAAVLILINQPTTTTTRTETAVGPATTALAAEMPKDRSPAFCLQMLEQANALAASPARWMILHNHRGGSTVAAPGAGALAAPVLATGAYVHRRLSKFPGSFPGPR